MPWVTVRVDAETKAKMDRLKNLDWSHILRERISEILERDSRKNRMEARRSMERLSRKSPPGWDSTAFIRKMRETRYRPRSGRR